MDPSGRPSSRTIVLSRTSDSLHHPPLTHRSAASSRAASGTSTDILVLNVFVAHPPRARHESPLVARGSSLAACSAGVRGSTWLVSCHGLSPTRLSAPRLRPRAQCTGMASSTCTPLWPARSLQHDACAHMSTTAAHVDRRGALFFCNGLATSHCIFACAARSLGRAPKGRFSSTSFWHGRHFPGS